MQRKTKIMLCSVGLSIVLGGCLNMESQNGNQDSENAIETHAAPSGESLVSVQEYTGEGYTLPNGKVTEKIAEENGDQIKEAAIKLFKDKYKTDVTVHNIVGARDGATVFVESSGEPHFYTYAVVPIDVNEKKVKTDQIWADEYQVQNAIQGGLYYMIFNKEFGNLDHYLEALESEGHITGKTKEALQKVGGHGFMTPYYFISTASDDKAIKPVYDLYVANPDEKVENLRKAFDESSFDTGNFQINIQLFMKEKKQEPSKELFSQVTTDLEKMTGIPRGAYSLYLNDNFIHQQSSEGAKENSLKRAFPDYIIKD